MTPIDPLVAAGIVITLAAIFAYANERWLQFPETIGLMVVAMILSLVLVLVGTLNPSMMRIAQEFMEQIDFNDTLMHGMLGFLLFAGALHVKLDDLAEQKWVVTITATLGVIGSTLLVGILHMLMALLKLDVIIAFLSEPVLSGFTSASAVLKGRHSGGVRFLVQEIF